MNITDFLARLSRGPLANLSMANDGDGTINVTKHAALVQHINDGLLKLYAQFNLHEKELIIEQQDGVTEYKIHSDYSVTTFNATPAPPAGFVPYIIDTLDKPFVNDLIKIVSVATTNGDPVPLNDEFNSASVFTPKYNLLQVPFPVTGTRLYCIYQARHAPLSAATLSATIDLPEVLIEGLEAYVAAKVYGGMNSAEHLMLADKHGATFKDVMAEVIDKDLVNTSPSNTNTKFDSRGFV